MSKPLPFEISELKDELERALGFRICELVRLDGASAVNFGAVRESDGLKFLVKCMPRERRNVRDNLVEHLDLMRGAAVERLFAQECPETFRGYSLVCLTWCEGVRLFPDELTLEQLQDFLKEYLLFSQRIQSAKLVMHEDPIAEWRILVLRRCRGFWGRRIRMLIERTMSAEKVRYEVNRLQVIHGDFHHGNFHFVDGRLSGIFDLEEFCRGYPADDIVRYFVCAAEHLKWAQYRKRQIVRQFACAVRALPYPSDEWIVAINGLFTRKLEKKTRRGVGFLCWARLFFASRFYTQLRKVVNEVNAS